jgi:transposase
MKAYSQDLRKRIVQAVETTGNQTQVALTFKVSRSTVRRLLKLEIIDPDLKPQPLPGRDPKVTSQDYGILTALLQAQNDLTLQELCQHFSIHYGLNLSISTMSRLLKKVGWTRKKRVWQPPNVMKNTELNSKPNSLV